MNNEKLGFLQNDFMPLISKIDAGAKPLWGVMNAQQMVEHVASFFKTSSGKLIFPLVTPVEHLPKYRQFLYNDVPFKENTKAPAQILTEVPLPLQHPDMTTAIAALQVELDDFIAHYKDDQIKTNGHPVFGELNFDEWITLNYKHVLHHLRQFGITA